MPKSCRNLSTNSTQRQIVDFHPVAITARLLMLLLLTHAVRPAGYRLGRFVYQLTHLSKLWKLKQQRRNGRPFFRAFDEHRCIFVHIPKCAGISISNSLFQTNTPHLTLQCYESIFGRGEFSAYFKFAVVRNPWDRVVSAYHYLMAGGRTPKDREWTKKHLSRYPDFETFIQKGLASFQVQRCIHFRPQSEFICIATRRIPLQFLALFENLEEDFAAICEQLKISARLEKLNLTPTRKKDFRDYYSPEAQLTVAKVYAEDLANLGYTFDNSSLESQLKARTRLSETTAENPDMVAFGQEGKFAAPL